MKEEWEIDVKKQGLFGNVQEKGEWDKLKQHGSEHYKTGGVEPIDLYRALGIFTYYAISSIIKYAARMVKKGVNVQDCDKIIDLAQKLKATL